MYPLEASLNREAFLIKSITFMLLRAWDDVRIEIGKSESISKGRLVN